MKTGNGAADAMGKKKGDEDSKRSVDKSKIACSVDGVAIEG